MEEPLFSPEISIQYKTCTENIPLSARFERQLYCIVKLFRVCFVSGLDFIQLSLSLKATELLKIFCLNLTKSLSIVFSILEISKSIDLASDLKDW